MLLTIWKKQPRLSPSGLYKLENQDLMAEPELSHTCKPGSSLGQNNRLLEKMLRVVVPMKTSLQL